MKEYIGDSVYMSEGSYAGEIILTTENGLSTDPSNTIYIELDALENAVAIAKKWLAIKKRGEQQIINEEDKDDGGSWGWDGDVGD